MLHEGEPVTDRGWPTGNYCPVGRMDPRPHNHELCLRMWPPSAVAEWEGPGARLRVKMLTGRARMPTQAYADDAGWDLYSAQEAVIIPGSTVKVELDIAVQLSLGYGAWMVGRSSTWGRGLMVMQTLIDHGYRGPLFAMVWNMRPQTLTIEVGERLAQLVPFRTDPMVAVPAVELDDHPRGGNGFGSTGR